MKPLELEYFVNTVKVILNYAIEKRRK